MSCFFLSLSAWADFLNSVSYFPWTRFLILLLKAELMLYYCNETLPLQGTRRFHFFNSRLLFLIWRRNWRLVRFWFWNYEWNSSFFILGREWKCSVVLLCCIFYDSDYYLFWGTFGKCAADQWELKLAGWEHPDPNIDLTHKAEQIANWSISPDVFSPRYASAAAETLSVCTYDTIFLLDPSALQLQPPHAASCPIFDPHVYAWLFTRKRENGTVTAYPKLLYRDKQRKKMCIRPGVPVQLNKKGVRNCKEVGNRGG